MKKLWNAFVDWGDVPIFRYDPIVARRIDILIAIGGLICVGYYGYHGGWIGVFQGILLYTLVVMIALWFL